MNNVQAQSEEWTKADSQLLLGLVEELNPKASIAPGNSFFRGYASRIFKSIHAKTHVCYQDFWNRHSVKGAKKHFYEVSPKLMSVEVLYMYYKKAITSAQARQMTPRQIAQAITDACSKKKGSYGAFVTTQKMEEYFETHPSSKKTKVSEETDPKLMTIQEIDVHKKKIIEAIGKKKTPEQVAQLITGIFEKTKGNGFHVTTQRMEEYFQTLSCLKKRNLFEEPKNAKKQRIELPLPEKKKPKKPKGIEKKEPKYEEGGLFLMTPLSPYLNPDRSESEPTKAEIEQYIERVKSFYAIYP